MLQNKIGYSYNDVTIVPSVISEIKSRSECNPYINGKLPIFASPMASVVSEENYTLFEQNGIIPILPRIKKYDINYRIKKIHQGWWVAVSLKELENDIINDLQTTPELNNKDYRICVDIANGHMKYLYTECSLAKTLARKRGINLIIMTGNIANAKTYEWIYENALYQYTDENGYNYYDCAIDFYSHSLKRSQKPFFFSKFYLSSKFIKLHNLIFNKFFSILPFCTFLPPP